MKIWRLGAAGAALTVVAVVIASLVMLYLWNWLNPADFWQRIFGLLVVLLVGAAAFVGLLGVFFLLMLALFGFTMRRKIKKMMKDFG